MYGKMTKVNVFFKVRRFLVRLFCAHHWVDFQDGFICKECGKIYEQT